MAQVSRVDLRFRSNATAIAFSDEEHDEEEEESEESNLFMLDYDCLSPQSSNFYNPSFDDFSFAPNLLSESESENSDSGRSGSILNPFFCSNGDDLNFAAELQFPDESVPRVFGDCFNDELGFGIGGDIDDVVFASDARDFWNLSSDGLRVVGIESESDSDDAEIRSDVSDSNGVLRAPSLRDCFRFDDHEEFEWEEVNERAEERENLSSLIDRIEEISVSSGITNSEGENPISDEEEVQNLEWEVLLGVNNLERHFELENDGLEDDLNVHEDYINATDYDPLFGQFSDGAVKGSPPAAKHIVDNLPSVVLSDEEENNVSCAVCKDEILVGERANRLPCSHLYHGDCIVPWLSIRNTCPVCRYELPTDDADYEKKKSIGRTNSLNDFEVRYNFEILP